MLAIISRLLVVIWQAIILLAQFIAILVLGILAALLLALPWLLRLVSLMTWLLGGFLAIQVIQRVYGVSTPAGPLLALQFAVIFLMVAWLGVLFKKAPAHTWGGLLLGGLLAGWIAWQGVPLLLARWQSADLFLRVLPPALLALTMFFMTLRLRFLRSSQQLKLVDPAFLWLPKACSPGKELFHNEETMSESTQTNNLINSLLGRDIDTDHGGLTLGDVIVLILDIVLLIYTGWRSYDFLTTSVPAGYELLALVGLWGLDIGAVAWSLVWIFGSATKYQDWTSMFFFVFDLVGVILTSLTDSLMYGNADSAMSTMLSGIAVVIVPLIVVANAVAGFIYHMTSPQTKQRRAKRRAENEHFEKMQEIDKLERDLQYAESYILARQEVLDKSVALAQIKMLQDQTEREMRLALRDQTGIHGLSPQMNGDDGKERLVSLRNRIESLRNQAQNLAPEVKGQVENAPAPAPLPVPVPVSEPAGFSNNGKDSGNGHHPPEPQNFS